MALIDKLFGKKEKTLSELSGAELRREEILLTKERDKMFKRIEQIAADKQKIFQQGATQKSPELRKALAMQFELKTQEQMMAGRQLNVRSKELLTVSRVRILKENMPKSSGAMGRLNLSAKDVERITSWIEDDSVTQDVYNERLDEMLGIGAQSDKDAMERAGLSSTGQELMNIWNDMDRGTIKEDEAFAEADKAVRKKNEAMEKNL
jgi:DNA replication protein DnaD